MLRTIPTTVVVSVGRQSGDAGQGRAWFVVWNEFGDHSANSAADLNGCASALLLHSYVIDATMAAPTFGWWMCSLGPGKNTPSSWRTVAGQFTVLDLREHRQVVQCPLRRFTVYE